MHYSFLQCSLKGTRSELDFDEFNLEFALGLSGSVRLEENKINKFFRGFVAIHVLHLSAAFAADCSCHLERRGNYT